MTSKSRFLAIAIYGLAVMASGLLSLLGREGGTAGLKFGLVMGGLALVAALLLWMNLRLLGTAVAWVAVAFVGGWFVYDAFIKRGFGQGDLRKYTMIALSLAAVAVLSVRSQPAARQQKGPPAPPPPDFAD